MLIFYWRFSLWKHRFLHTTKYPVFSQLRHISLRLRSSYHPQSCSAGAPSHLSPHSFVCWVSSSFFVSFVGFYWCIRWFKGCDRLNRCETKRFSYTHTHTSLFIFLSYTDYHRVLARLPVLPRKSLLASYSIYDSVHTPIPSIAGCLLELLFSSCSYLIRKTYWLFFFF